MQERVINIKAIKAINIRIIIMAIRIKANRITNNLIRIRITLIIAAN